MMTLFDQEYLTDIYVVKEQREDTQRSNVLRMHETGLPGRQHCNDAWPELGYRDRMNLERCGSGIEVRPQIL